MIKICEFCKKEYNWEEGQLNWTKNGPGICNGNIRSDKFCCYICGKKDRYKKSQQTKLKRYGNKNYNNIEKNKTTCLKKYGVEHVTQTQEFKEKSKQTCLEKYGVEYSFQSKNNKEKAKITCLKRYGVSNPAANVKIKEKIKNTNLQRYGVDNPAKSNEIKEKIKHTNKKKYGCDNAMQNNNIKVKSYERRKAIHSYSKSKEEDTVFKWLSEKFDKVERQYKSKEYPFNCDFYIPELKLYIEYQGFWHHGNYKRKKLGAYNKNNPIHQKVLLEWKKKSKTRRSYVAAINIWTNIDPIKRKIAKENGLNLIEFFNLNEAKEWINSLS